MPNLPSSPAGEYRERIAEIVQHAKYNTAMHPGDAIVFKKNVEYETDMLLALMAEVERKGRIDELSKVSCHDNMLYVSNGGSLSSINDRIAKLSAGKKEGEKMRICTNDMDGGNQI